MRYWLLKKGNSRTRVRADDMAAAKDRGGQIGFHKPDVVRLLDDHEIDNWRNI